MPASADDHARAGHDVDFSQYADIANTNTISAGTEASTQPDISGATSTNGSTYPTLDDDIAFMGDWDLPIDPSVSLQEPDYSKFENWIPKYSRPEKPCDYCRSRRLVCYLARSEASCTSCSSLFRECSLTNSQTLEASNYGENANGTFLDTLHVVDEDAAKERGTFTGIKPLASKGGPNSGTSTPVRDDAPGSSKRNGIRFPRHAVKQLREWLDAHPDHPYPTEAEKAELEKRTELQPMQIANWLANARRRRKVSEKARPKSCKSPSLRPSTPSMAIPGANLEKSWDELNPFERWQNSPPENDPASITDIANAVANSELPEDDSTSPSSAGVKEKRSSNGSGFSNYKAPSTTSLDTSGQSSSHSASSAAFSHGSSQSRGSFGSFNSSLAGKKDRRRRRRPAQTNVRRLSDDKRRVFQCTFCTDTFKSKYDWTRHEKSLHLSLEKWICAPLGPMTTSACGQKKCVYCNVENPEDSHFEGHNHRQCEEKGLDARTFYRKDHLRQHLRLMHGCAMTPEMDSWKAMAANINSRCGFCAQRFTIWQERVDHLTAHFKAGARMSEWKGCRGLDPAVAAQVTNAMPPYLIGIESVSPNPFSATNRGTWRQGPYPQDSKSRKPSLGEPQAFNTKATCWEILTVRLGKFASEANRKGIILTDEILQTQARRLLFDSDDTWNQTAADNPEWLDLFKKAHGLSFIPSTIGGQGMEVPEDLETYGDLGLRIPFAVQLQAYNDMNKEEQNASKAADDSSPYRVALEKRRLEFRDAYALMAKEGFLHEENFNCQHKDCKSNTIDLSAIDGRNTPGPRNKRWCNQEIPKDMAKKLSAVTNPLLHQRLNVMGNAHSDIMKETQQMLAMDKYFESDFDSDEPTARQCQFNNFTAAQARAHSLNTLASAESECCSFVECNARQDRAANRAKGLSALARAEAPIPATGGRSTYLRRHKYEMPKTQAPLFATTTPAWEDSGKMPQPVNMSPINETSTGAMMEFLGGEAGQHLPFSNDPATSSIPLDSSGGEVDFNGWDFPVMADMDETALMKDLDEFMATSHSGQAQGVSALSNAKTTAPSNAMMDAGWMGEGQVGTNDMVMDDVNFDDLTFDGVFDIQMDGGFGGHDGH